MDEEKPLQTGVLSKRDEDDPERAQRRADKAQRRADKAQRKAELCTMRADFNAACDAMENKIVAQLKSHPELMNLIYSDPVYERLMLRQKARRDAENYDPKEMDPLGGAPNKGIPAYTVGAKK